MDNLRQGLERTRKLLKFIKSRRNLGIAETKDELQVQAQLDSQQAQLQALNIAWTQQRIALNRLMGRPWDAAMALSPMRNIQLPEGEMQSFLQDALKQQGQLRTGAVAVAVSELEHRVLNDVQRRVVVADSENGLFEGATLDSRKEVTQFVFASQGTVSPCRYCDNRGSVETASYAAGACSAVIETGPYCAGFIVHAI